MNETPSFRRDKSRRGGFTLIEVVIALAIFVFGALAIIRIFPPALGVIQNSGDRMVATNLNRSLLATLEKQEAPDGTFDSALDGAAANWNNSSVGSVAGTRRNNTLPRNNVQDYSGSSLAHFKNIAAERHTIAASHILPLPTKNVVLTQFPFAGTIEVYKEDNVDGVQIKSDGTLDFTSSTRESTGLAYDPVATPGIGYVSYRWSENGRYWNVNEERIALAAANPTVFQKSRTGVQIIPGEVSVRLRTLITPDSVDANRGRIVINATDAPEGTKVSVDYKVSDWRWLVYDGYASSSIGNPPTATTKAVTLPIRVLDIDQPNYLFTAYPAQDLNPTLGTQTNFPDPSVAKTSTIPFDFGAATTDSPQVRVLYRTADDWTQQLSVAAKYYTLFDPRPSSPADKWRECDLSNAGGFLYFHPSEAGKTIEISYTYTGGTPSTAANDKTVVNRILTIDDDIVPTPGDVTDGAAFDSNVARLQLTNVQGGNLGTPPTSIQKIKGISIQSRMAWLDGDRFTQVSSTSYRGGNDQ